MTSSQSWQSAALKLSRKSLLHTKKFMIKIDGAYEDFANWYLKNQLLGYSYSTTLKRSFLKIKQRHLSAMRTNIVKQKKRERVKVVMVVEDIISGVSRNGNKYIKMKLSDEIGSIDVMFGDFRKPNLTQYKERGNATPTKGSIIVAVGEKGDDIMFADNISLMDEKIYMSSVSLNRV